VAKSDKSYQFGHQKEIYIAVLACLGIALHLVLRYYLQTSDSLFELPLLAVLVLGGIPLLYDLLLHLVRGEFGSDLLAGISIVTAALLHEYLAGSLVVLMLSGGEALEHYAIGKASSVLSALAKRMPQIAHHSQNGKVTDIAVSEIQIGDEIVIFPHEICPVDGEVLEGHGSMDESFLTGEPFNMQKTPGSDVLSGAVNGDAALTIRASRLAIDSRYAKIMRVMEQSEQNRPSIRRLGDKLGAIYTPIAVLIGVVAWICTQNPVRFLAVMVIATPCPLLIAIPVAIIGTISLAARRGIIIKSPSQLEQIENCSTIIFDKTGTLTYGKPSVTEILCAQDITADYVLRLVATVEQYSKHPLSLAVIQKANQLRIPLMAAEAISEKPGQGLTGRVRDKHITVTSRSKLNKLSHQDFGLLPALSSGLECIVLIDDRYAATFRFHDAPRADSKSFIAHLSELHRFERVMLLSGDRESEVKYFAEAVGIKEVYSEKTPEEKLKIVIAETKRAKTVYVGDGINDAPALTQATVGIALGQHNEITSEAAGAVIMDASLEKVDDFFHLGRRMRQIALESAVGGMLVSLLGMMLAALGLLSPVQGAVGQELIDLAAVINALRASFPPKTLSDFSQNV